MATDDTLPITFAVSGSPASGFGASRGSAAEAAGLPGRVKASVRVTTLRDGGAAVRAVAVPGEDIVALHLAEGSADRAADGGSVSGSNSSSNSNASRQAEGHAGGPVLLLHPATARDLLLGPAGGRRAGGGDVPVGTALHWPGAAAAAPAHATGRGLGDIGHAVLTGFQVLTGLLKDPAADFAASQVVQRVDGQVDAGVYALPARGLSALKGSAAKLARVPPRPDGGPLLVLLHGTFVDTASTFGALWAQHPGAVHTLFSGYAGAVYALDHPTLGASPIANARTLVEALPSGARLHLLTHSRGGLVAEVLARVAAPAGVGAADLAFFNAPGYAGQQQELRDLAALVRARRVQVDRVVRVACPARGTLLASGRLDAYLSVLKWTLQVAGVPVLPPLLDFIGEVARRRASPAQIPGLAAMIPGTPLLDWLNSAPGAIPGDLRVVAGDLQRGSTLGSWLKALLADAYYRTDNDIVVHTASMYGGAPRAGGATFLLDQGAGVTHFDYFRRDLTVAAVTRALTEPQPAGFGPIGPLSWAGLDGSGERAKDAAGARPAPDPAKPAVFMLPGILGSHLKQGVPPDDDRVWLGPRLVGGFDRLAYQPGGADGVAEDGPIGLSYDALAAFLRATHEVISFGYDWRRPLEEEAARLAARVREALDARQASGQPVRIVAHSMGGLLARTLALVDGATWQRLMAHPGARFLMLGTPNGGSWAPMQVLSGDDTLGQTLAALGSPFANQRARMQMAAMPGFMQLQAGLLDPRLGLHQHATWQKLADDDLRREQQKNWWQRYAGDVTTAVYAWGVPPQAVLDQARALRLRLDAQPADRSGRTLLVVGRAPLTPVGFQVADDDGFAYLSAPGGGDGSTGGGGDGSTGGGGDGGTGGGDGRVPLASALLPGVPTWQAACDHGSLPSTASAFGAYLDLLLQGHTAQLPPLAAAAEGARGAAPTTPVRSRPSRQAPPAPAPADDDNALPAMLPPLRVTVLNGNLSFIKCPLMLGHYRALELTGTEAVVDDHLGGALQAALALGLYPDAPGSHGIFINSGAARDNPWQPARPHAAIVVGLGEEGVLSSAQLELTVCQGAKAWAQRAREQGTALPDGGGIDIAATLMGSGGMGISAGTAARAIARGVRLANQRLASSETRPPWPLITGLTLVEWYLDRASEAWHGLRVLAAADPHAFHIAPAIASGVGPLRRQPDSGYRGADYDLITARTEPGVGADGTISFALDTRRARTEVRAQRTQATLLRKLVERAATAQASDPRLGQTLFQLLVPLELKPFLSGTDRVLLQLDAGTAPIPWELLDTGPDADGDGIDDNAAGQARGGGPGGTLPWAIRTRLLRKLASTDFRNAPRDAGAEAAVLVVGEPLIDDPGYPPLPGARSEAATVAALFSGPDGVGEDRVTALLDSPEFDTVIVALMARPWRIVHVAGHGAPAQLGPQGEVLSRGGVVLSQGVFLGPDEIAKLPQVPELVFVNCCHLGGHDAAHSLAVRQPVAFAAGVADALIQIGVRCVIAAGWAVDDRPAEVFAQVFYRTLLAGRPFVDAVAAARQAALAAAPDSKTWAAYQCYGDPNWTFRRPPAGHRAGAAAPAAPSSAGSSAVRDEHAGIASALGLTLTLEALALRADPGGAEPALPIALASAPGASRRQRIQPALRALQDRYAESWGGMGAVAEAFGVAWQAAGDAAAAIGWYERALCAADASASLKAQERLGLLRLQQAWTVGAGTGFRPGLGHAAEAAQALTQARHNTTTALRELQALAALQPTPQRLFLCGLAWQRLAQLDDAARPDQAPAAALASASASVSLSASAPAPVSARQPGRRSKASAAGLASLTMAAQAYGQAETLCSHDPHSLPDDPGLKQMAVLCALHAADPRWAGFEAAASTRVQQRLQSRHASNPDVYSAAALVDHPLCMALAGRDLAAQAPTLAAAYAAVHARLPAPAVWARAADNALLVLAAAQSAATGPDRQAASALSAQLQGYVAGPA